MVRPMHDLRTASDSSPSHGGGSTLHTPKPRLEDIPVEQDYPASAWDISTDYGPRKTWLDVREEVRLAAQRERIK